MNDVMLGATRDGVKSVSLNTVQGGLMNRREFLATSSIGLAGLAAGAPQDKVTHKAMILGMVKGAPAPRRSSRS